MFERSHSPTARRVTKNSFGADGVKIALLGRGLPLEVEMRVKWRVDSYEGGHVRVTFFAGKGDTLVNIGTLTMRVEEYQAIGAALLLGTGRMMGNLVVEHDDEVFVEEVARRELEEDDV